MKHKTTHTITSGLCRAIITATTKYRITHHSAAFFRVHIGKDGTERLTNLFGRYDIARLHEVMSLAYAWIIEADRAALKRR